MTDRNKWWDAISKLIELTQDDKLKWEVSTPSEFLRRRIPNGWIGALFKTEYKGRQLRLYEYQYKTSGTYYLDQQMDEGYWVRGISLELYDASSDVALWSFPNVDILDDLFSAVQYQSTGVKDFIEEILEE